MTKKQTVLFGISFGLFLVLAVFATSLEIIDIGAEFGFSSDLLTGFGVRYSESQGVITVRFLINGAFLNINGSVFKDIIPVTEKTAYIRVDSNLSIISAEFTVSGEKGVYRFNDEVIEVPNGTRVVFDRQSGINLDIPDGADLRGFPSLLSYVSDQHQKLIRGKDIKISDDFNLIDGSLRVDKNGYFLEKGRVNYQQNLLNAKNIYEKILIANPNEDMSGYDGNWIRQTNDILEIQSSRNGEVNIEFLENHDILNNDRSELSASINLGDGLRFEKREDQGFVPRAIHKSSADGFTSIKNGKTDLEFKGGNLIMEPPGFLTAEDFLENKYQSVAFEIESDSFDTDVRFNSYGQFAILSNRNEDMVVYNKDGFPISARIRDNKLTKLELRKKLIEEEYVIPKEVMGTLDHIVDPNDPYGMGTIPIGAFMNVNCLTSKKEQNQFKSELRKLGYSENEIETFLGVFKEGNIVLNENVLAEQSFVKILLHERLHRKIYLLNPQETSTLNEAQDFIIDDFKKKSEEIAVEADKYVSKYNAGEISWDGYKEKQREIIKKYDPILLDKEGGTGYYATILTIRPEEFYTFLQDGRLHPKVEAYLKTNFPDSYRIYLQLRDDISKGINNRIISIFD